MGRKKKCANHKTHLFVLDDPTNPDDIRSYVLLLRAPRRYSDDAVVNTVGHAVAIAAESLLYGDDAASCILSELALIEGLEILFCGVATAAFELSDFDAGEADPATAEPDPPSPDAFPPKAPPAPAPAPAPTP